VCVCVFRKGKMPRPGPRPYECVRRAWHSDRHKPIRGSMIGQILRFWVLIIFAYFEYRLNLFMHFVIVKFCFD
jgi:hypothetical protein